MSNLRIAELDFNEIKTNLKNYLQAQSEFTDYDFEGSGLAVLLDVLAYNTHYNAYLANMLANEMFLDSAVKRASAVSLAKHLGYTPISARGARAVVDIAVGTPTGSPLTLTLPRYTPFTSTVNGTTLPFTNLEEITISPVGGIYTFTDVELAQGQVFTYSYTVSATPGPAEKYVIPATNVDTTSLRVVVQKSTVDLSTTVYSLATDITGVTGTSKVYFLQENPQEKYEVFFGDGILGNKLEPGNIVILQYITTDGDIGNVSGNVAQSFTIGASIGGSTTITIATQINSRGGTGKESISSIKFNAPAINAAKNRAVTAEDYRALITSSFTEAESVSIWGGEDNIPPIYGKVIIALKPYDGFTISQDTKNRIARDIIASKKVLAIQPEFIDPEYFYINLFLNVKYNPNLTNLSASQIETVIRNSISTYFSNNLGKFNQDFYIYRMLNEITSGKNYIISVLPEVRIQKRLVPLPGTVNNYSGDNRILFENKLHPGRLQSSFFFVNISGTNTLVYFKDVPDSSTVNYEGTGTLKLYNAVTDNLVNANYGTVGYGTGEVSIPSVVYTGYPTGISEIKITCELQEASYDISVARNRILLLDDTAKNVAVGVDQGITINIAQKIE